MTRKKVAAFAAVLVLLSALAASCRGWPEMERDIREVRSLHRGYRDHTVARSATDTAEVEALAGKIDSILGKMEELSR